jgi:hypothetical protein
MSKQVQKDELLAQSEENRSKEDLSWRMNNYLRVI